MSWYNDFVKGYFAGLAVVAVAVGGGALLIYIGIPFIAGVSFSDFVKYAPIEDSVMIFSRMILFLGSVLGVIFGLITAFYKEDEAVKK